MAKEMVKVKGVAYWANVQKPNKTFDPNGVWQIDLEISEKDQKRLEKLGIPMIEKKSGMVVFRPKRKCLKTDGSENEKPIVYDKFGKESPLEIGNGSEVEVVFSTFPYKRIKQTGADLTAIKVVNLVPYSSDASKDLFDFEEDVEIAEENPFE